MHLSDHHLTLSRCHADVQQFYRQRQRAAVSESTKNPRRKSTDLRIGSRFSVLSVFCTKLTELPPLKSQKH